MLTKDPERPSLFDKTREMVTHRSRVLTLEKISEDTGLSLSWLRYFTQERCTDSRSERIQCLYEYMAGKNLDY